MAFSLATLELGCRLLGIEQPRLYRTDSDRGWSLKANVRSQWRQEGSAPVSTNSEGYRDRQWSRVKKPGVLRIAVLGDSFTEALQVSLAQTWVNQLPEAMDELPSCPLLKGFPKGAETLNFGVGGYGTGQSWLTWKKDAQRFEPQLVLHAVYFENDLRDNTESKRGSGSGPTFSLNQGSLSRSNAFRNSPDYRFRESFAGQISDWFLGWSRLAQLINQLKNLRNGRAGEECGSDGCSFFPLGPDGTKLYGKEHKDLEEEWSVLISILKAWNKETDMVGSRLVVASLTTPAQVWPNQKQRDLVQSIHGLDWFKPEKNLNNALKGEIPYISLGQQIQKQAIEQNIIIHGFKGQKPGPGYGHWNKDGHRAAANALARELCSMDLEPIND